MYNSVLTIAPSPVDRKTIWAGTDDGQVQLTTDGGKSWLNLTKQVQGLPEEAWIVQIQASRYKAEIAWMVVNNYRKGDYKPYLFKTDDYGKNWSIMADESKVKGYALAVIQDPVEPKLVFLGTENGLWISIDEGKTWVQFNQGFPSVSTMDLAIQEPESALIVGTFGRAIWILDDLLSLREIAAKRIKNDITALPVNDAVQVKGLFINPPGNIWTGFHTTFEGENRVFQKTEIPFFLSEQPDTTQVVTANIYNSKNELINAIKTKKLEQGLNYFIWKLDEQASVLPGAWIHDDFRGIPVLSGTYKVVLHYENAKDSTYIKILNDPRFDLANEVDVKLYEFKKDVDGQVAILSKLLVAIDKKKERLQKLESELDKSNNKKYDQLKKGLKKIKTELDVLRAKGQTPRPNRQVGAWQSFSVSPYSKVNDALKVAAARTSIPSIQDRQLIKDASILIDKFVIDVEKFNKSKWLPFEKMVNSIYANWFKDQP